MRTWFSDRSLSAITGSTPQDAGEGVTLPRIGVGHEQPLVNYGRYAEFLAADRRRTGEALELGADWRDGDGRYRVCWYEQTSELTFERLSADEPLDLEDFHRGVSGPVEIVARIGDRRELGALLGEWPNIAVGLPRTLESLRSLLGRNRSSSPQRTGTGAPEGGPGAASSGDGPPTSL